MAKSAIPSIFYVYGNSQFREEIKAACIRLFPNVAELSIFNPNGCGFKVECYDINDLRQLDIDIEPYEGWIQTQRRNDFSDINADVQDFDRFIGGCNNRITFDSTGSSVWNKDYIKYKVNAHKDLVVVRNLNFTNNSALDGFYRVIFGNDTVSGGIPIGATLDLNRVMRKTLNGETFEIQSDNASLTGFIIEYKGNEYRKYDITGYPIGGSDITYWKDNDISTRYSWAMSASVSADFQCHLKKAEYLKNEEDSMYVKTFNFISAFRNAVDSGHHGNIIVRFKLDGVVVQEENFNNVVSATSDTATSTDWRRIEVNKIIDEFDIFVQSVELDYNTVYNVWDVFLSV